MARYEWPALLGLALSLRYAAPSDPRLRYIAIYGGGVLLAYSLIPYKTPWCIISILWPFYLILGSAACPPNSQGITFTPRSFLPLAAALSLLVSAGLSVRLNFFYFTNEKEPYVYVQTYREIETLTTPLLAMARQDPRYYHVSGQIVLESYYPLPWMLGDFTQIGYYKKEEPPGTYDADFIVVQENQVEEIEAKLTGDYYKQSFRLRDSQEQCVVYFRRDTYQHWFKDVPPIVHGKP